MIPYDINELVPHDRTMSLLDNVIECDTDSLKASVTIHRDSMFAEEQGIPAWIGVEYMAQAISAWAGYQDKEMGREVNIGFLVGTRRYQSNLPYFPIGATLIISIDRELQGDNGLGVFNCRIESSNLEVTAALNVFQPNNVDEFLEQQSAEAQP